MKVTAFAIAGLDLFFHTLDHCPPHFHALKPGEWEIRIDIDRTSEANGLVYTIKFPKKLPKGYSPLSRKEEKELLKYVIEKKVELLSQWQAKVSTREII